jgi:hypothetical protein
MLRTRRTALALERTGLIHLFECSLHRKIVRLISHIPPIDTLGYLEAVFVGCHAIQDGIYKNSTSAQLWPNSKLSWQAVQTYFRIFS